MPGTMIHSGLSLVSPLGPAENVGQQKSQVNEDAKPWRALKLDAEWSNFERFRPQIKSLARKGIHKDYRSKVWFHASGASELKSLAPSGYYVSMAASTSNLSDEIIYLIEEEVRNIFFTLPYFSFLKTARNTEGLSRILLAFASRNPHCGFYKGIHLLAGIIWAMLGRDHEEDAFWVLVALIEKNLLPTFSGELNTALKVEVAVLDALVAQKLPGISSHFAKVGSNALSLLTSSWFSTGFVSVLPIQVVLRLWDCIFVEGSKVVHRFALALLKINGTCVTSCVSIDTLSRVMESRVRKVETEPLMHTAFRSLGSFPKSQVLYHRIAALKSITGSSIALVVKGSVSSATVPRNPSSTTSSSAASGAPAKAAANIRVSNGSFAKPAVKAMTASISVTANSTAIDATKAVSPPAFSASAIAGAVTNTGVNFSGDNLSNGHGHGGGSGAISSVLFSTAAPTATIPVSKHNKAFRIHAPSRSLDGLENLSGLTLNAGRVGAGGGSGANAGASRDSRSQTSPVVPQGSARSSSSGYSSDGAASDVLEIGHRWGARMR